MNGNFCTPTFSGPLITGKMRLVMLVLMTLLFSKGVFAQCMTITAQGINHPTSCGEDDGYFTIIASGISLPYQFRLEKEINGSYVHQSNGTQLAGNPIFVGLTAGNYRVILSKENCTDQIDVVLNQPSMSMNVSNINHPSSCGEDDGSFSTPVTGLVPPYQFRLEKEINGSYVHQSTPTTST